MIFLPCFLVLSFGERLFASRYMGCKLEPDRNFNIDNYDVDPPTFEIREPKGFRISFNVSVARKDFLYAAYLYFGMNRRVRQDGIRFDLYDEGVFERFVYDHVINFMYVEEKKVIKPKDWIEFLIHYNKDWEYDSIKWQRRYRVYITEL